MRRGMGRSREDVSHVCAIAVKIRQDGAIVVVHAGLEKSMNTVKSGVRIGPGGRQSSLSCVSNCSG